MLKTSLKSKETEEAIVQMIVRDGLKSNDPILSENKLSALLGVSRVTVRNAIGRLEEAGVLRSENGRGTFVVKAPKAGKRERLASKLIGFACFGGIDNIFMASVARGIESGAELEGFNICASSVIGGAEREAEVVRSLLKRGVDGLIVSPTESNPPSAFMTELARSMNALVLVDVSIPGFEAPSVACDDLEGGLLATSSLLEAGHRRIAHIRGPSLVENAIARFDGYRKALDRAGIPFKEELAPPSDPHCGYNEESGAMAMKKLLELPEEERPTAVFAANDNLAIGAWKALRERGLSVPGDISLIGYGGLYGMELSSVNQRPREIGREAWGIIKRIIDGDASARRARLLLRPELIRGSSVASPKRS